MAWALIFGHRQGVVEKLPFGLQERWLTLGFQYKEDHDVSFLPFTFFTNFICNEARRRNYPSLTLSTVPTSQSHSSNRFSIGKSKAERMERRSGYVKGHVSAPKTEVTSCQLATESESSDGKHSDIDRQCPIHKNLILERSVEVSGARHLKNIKFS